MLKSSLLESILDCELSVCHRHPILDIAEDQSPFGNLNLGKRDILFHPRCANLELLNLTFRKTDELPVNLKLLSEVAVMGTKSWSYIPCKTSLIMAARSALEMGSSCEPCPLATQQPALLWQKLRRHLL